MKKETYNTSTCPKISDESFDSINNLQWLPWIGSNYISSKLMIIGESHYEDGDHWQAGNKNTTRIITQKRLDDHPGKWTLHRNIEKLLLHQSSVSLNERIELYNNFAYWNLVQRLLDSRDAVDRPSDEDFDTGWEVFFNLVEVLRPTYCLVLGKSSFGRLCYYLNNMSTDWYNIQENAPERKILHLHNGKNSIKLIFINHPSGSFGFRYQVWADLVKEEFSTLKLS